MYLLMDTNGGFTKRGWWIAIISHLITIYECFSNIWPVENKVNSVSPYWPQKYVSENIWN